MFAALAGIAVLVGFAAYSIIWSLLFGDELPILVRVGIGLAGIGILVLGAVIVRIRVKERSEENLEGIEP